ncbi:DUF2800 domain-containing protein [Xylanivirga thermophila]|jgi:cell division protein FtsI/penicillin-binding protein 2|uniref:DUF2800 domain-containing protein n=1 Tax=Xylanivirga thermophila TaxID=2496273 RepID=UPI00101BA72A|nr:DUF2800 domain-containing protein [Xylanivirga thermophila]
MTDHALLSASGADRWMACTPSPRAEESVSEESSEFAKEGTFAHTLAELKLSLHLGEISKKDYNKRLKELKTNEFYSGELEKYVDVYVNFAIEKINEAKARTKDALILLEMRLDYSPWVREGFGTGDLVLISDDVLEIVDLKFGKGIKVEAQDNSQLKLYSLGAINEFGLLYDIKTIKMTICQPRLDHISTDEVAADDLLDWAENIVKPLAELAYEGKGDFKSGDHCRFCRIRYSCRKRSEDNLKLACLDFRPPPTLTDEEIVEVLETIDDLVKWAKDVEEYAFKEAANKGKQWPGFKLVEGRRTRRYSSEEKVAKVLLDAGYEEEKIFSKSLLSLTKLEKELGKKEFEEILGDLIEIPPGKLKLVPDSDKRVAVKNSAEIDFKEEM